MTAGRSFASIRDNNIRRPVVIKRERMRSFLRLCILAGLTGLTAAAVSPDEGPSADRHLRLLRSVPAGGATLDSPLSAIEFWFSEAPEVRVTTVQLSDPAGETRRLDAVVADAEDDKHIIVAIDSLKEPGTYGIAWRTMSRDGHVVNGKIGFTIEAQR